MSASRKRLLDTFGSVREYAHTDETVNQGEDVVIEILEDCEPIIERAKMLSALGFGKDIRHAACVPQTVLQKSFTEGWFNDQQAWRKWANDPDNAKFRTWPGKL